MNWTVDVTVTGVSTKGTANASSLVPVKLEANTIDPTFAEVRDRQVNPPWHGVTTLRILYSKALVDFLTIPRPACGWDIRGRIWFTADAGGMKEHVAVCAKDATEQFSWGLL